MELRHLRYFVAVAEELNFSRAARRLHMAQPPLSQQIRTLERELDVSLFLRSKRRVEITDAGRVFLQEARRTLAQADYAVQAARRAQRGEIGQLRLGFMDSAAYHYLPVLVRAYRERFPGVEVALQEMTSAQQVQAILEDRVQVGLLRPDEIQRSELDYQVIGRERLMVAMASNHALASQDQISVEEIAGEPFISFRRVFAPAIYDHLSGLFRSSGLSPRIVWEANEQGTMIALVAAGMGLALVPETVQLFASQHVAYLPLKNIASLQTALAWRRSDHSELVRALATTAAKVFHRSVLSLDVPTASLQSP